MILYHTDKNYSYDLVNKAIFVVFGSLHCLLLFIKFLVVIDVKWFIDCFICKSFVKNQVHTKTSLGTLLESKELISKEKSYDNEQEIEVMNIENKDKLESKEVTELKFSESPITNNERIIYGIQVISIMIAFIFNIIFLFVNLFYGIAITTFLIICGEMLPFVQCIDFRDLFQKTFRMIDMFCFMIFINFIVYSFSNFAWIVTALSFFVFIYLIRVIVVRGAGFKPYDWANIGFILTVYFLQVFILCPYIKFFSLRE